MTDMRKTTRFFLLGTALSVSHAASAAWSDLLDVIGRGRDEVRLRMIDLHSLVETEARRHGLSPAYVAAVIKVESNTSPCALSHANAAGLMQIVGNTARRYGVYDRFDPRENVAAGTAYLAEMLQLAGGDLRRAAAAYNLGPKALTMPESRWPKETRNYTLRLARLLPAYTGENWRRYLVHHIPHADYGLCARERMS